MHSALSAYSIWYFTYVKYSMLHILKRFTCIYFFFPPVSYTKISLKMWKICHCLFAAIALGLFDFQFWQRVLLFLTVGCCTSWKIGMDSQCGISYVSYVNLLLLWTHAIQTVFAFPHIYYIFLSLMFAYKFLCVPHIQTNKIYIYSTKNCIYTIYCTHTYTSVI